MRWKFTAITLLAALLVTGSWAHGATILEPGYTDSLVGTIPASGSSAGAMVEDSAGNLYVVGATVPQVFRKTPSGSFATWATVPGNRCIGTALDGNTLYVGMVNGNIYTLDITVPSPPAVSFGSIPGAAQGLSVSCSPPSLLVGSSPGIFSLDLGTGASTQIYSGGNVPSIDCHGGGNQLLFTNYTSSQIMEMVPPAPASTFYSPTANSPDGIQIHPGTGFIYIATSGPDILQKLDPTGTTLTDFATGIDFSGGSYPSPLVFSVDGTKLYYGSTGPGGFTISVIDGFPGLASCIVNSPAPATTEQDIITVDFDADAVTLPTVTLTFEFSTDGGATYFPCTPAGGSPHPNPTNPIAVPATGEVFLWDSRADNVGVAAIDTTDLRLALNTGTSCAVTFDVDNTALCWGICGDCNLNGLGPDILDALEAAKVAAGLVIPTPAQVGCCDTNAAGGITVIDALGIAQSAAGLPVALICP